MLFILELLVLIYCMRGTEAFFLVSVLAIFFFQFVFYLVGNTEYTYSSFYYLQRDEWAQEVILDVFTTLWNHRKSQLIPDDFNKYSYILIRNAALNYLEKEQRREASPLENMPEISSSNLSPEEQMMNEELFNIYENSLNELPERCRTIFIKVREEKQSYASVAEELNISPKTVDAQLQKAVTRLKEKINNYFRNRR